MKLLLQWACGLMGHFPAPRTRLRLELSPSGYWLVSETYCSLCQKGLLK